MTLYYSTDLIDVYKRQEQTTAFGPYVFTSYQKQTVGDSTLLSGYVTLNNWLCFKGDLVLRGSLDNTQIQMEDSTGSYIRYYSGRSKGLAELLRSKNMVLPLPSLGTLKLYNDIQHNASDKEYQVDVGIIPQLTFPSAFAMNTPGSVSYPHLDVYKRQIYHI